MRLVSGLFIVSAIFFSLSQVQAKNASEWEVPAFWQQNTVLTLQGIPKERFATISRWLNQWVERNTQKEVQQPLTFSFDSEIPYDDVFRLFLETREDFQALDEVLKGQLFTKQALIRILKISEKQIQAGFVLRRGIPMDQGKYRMTDLNPRFFGLLFDAKLVNILNINPESRKIMKLLEGILRKRGFNISAHLDCGFIEITHESWETVPSSFMRIVGNIHSTFKRPQMHLHIGIPSVVSEKEMLGIARAVESKVILDMLVFDPTEGEALKYRKGSALRTDPNPQTKGVIRLGVREWKKPGPARSHNLEIRQWLDLNHGLGLLEFASHLAMNHQSLSLLDDFGGYAFFVTVLGAKAPCGGSYENISSKPTA